MRKIQKGIAFYLTTTTSPNKLCLKNHSISSSQLAPPLPTKGGQANNQDRQLVVYAILELIKLPARILLKSLEKFVYYRNLSTNHAIFKQSNPTNLVGFDCLYKH